MDKSDDKFEFLMNTVPSNQHEGVDFIVSERVFNKIFACRGKTVKRLKTGLEEKNV